MQDNSKGPITVLPRGNVGPAPTLTMGTVTELAPNATPTAAITGSNGVYQLNLGLPQGANGNPGPAASWTIGTVTELAPNAAPTASITGTNGNYQLNLGLPQGQTGAMATLGIGAVTALAPTAAPTASISGGNGNYQLNLGLPVLPGPFGASGANHAPGLVPDPGATAGVTRFLREDGLWLAPPPGVNANDAGYDVILVAGQSNAQGNGVAFDASLDISDPRVMQFASSGNYLNQIVAAIDPLLMPSPPYQRIGFAMTFARLYAASIVSNRKVLLVPYAVGGTGFTTGTAPGDWTAGTPGGALYEAAIAQANKAVLSGANNRFVGALWLQGEADAALTLAQYAAKIDALIAGFRSRIIGAASSWFLLGRMTPENIAVNPATYGANIDPAHLATPQRNALCAVFSGQPGYVNDKVSDYLHYNAMGQRFNGVSAFAALPNALANVAGAANPAVPVQVAGLTAGTIGGTTIALSWTSLVTPPLDYLVQYKRSIDATWLTFPHPISLANSIIVTGLSGATSYDFRVAGVNCSGVGTYSATMTAVTLATLMLDTLSVPVALAYSASRRLKSTWTGALIRVRRSSDNTEMDIGFTGANVLDTATLLAFAGTGSAYVKTEYEQGGSGNHATQADVTRQPRIVNAGALETLNGVPIPHWTAAAGLFTAAGHPVNADFSRFGVFAATGNGVNIMSNNGSYLWLYSGNFSYYDAANAPGVAMSAGVLHAGGVTFVQSTKTAKVYLDAASSAANVVASGSANAGFGVGCYESTGASSPLGNGYIAENFVLAGVASVADIAAILTSQKQFYGTP